VPLLGIVDTAVIGNTGSVEELGAIALGALVFSFVYWSFGFLRMGTTGFTAQASGAGDEPETRATLARALLLAGGIGTLLVVLQAPIAWIALSLLGATADVEALTRAYFDIRIWGAPGSLGTFAVLGTLVGLGRTHDVLKTQLVLNGLNITLDVVLGGLMGLGVRGIALGTAISEWVTLAYGLVLVGSILRARHSDSSPFWPWAQVLDRSRLLRTLVANADIMVRTLFLLMGFAWFTNQGARFGDEILAANHILLQTTLAAWSGVGLALAVLAGGGAAVHLLTDLEPVQDLASSHLGLTALYVALSFAAFQLDGIFIGATATRDMRNASVVAFGIFVAASLVLIPRWSNTGLWIAFVLYVAVRAAALGARYPRLRSRFPDASAHARLPLP
jgi:MATE family multidrug resistance protein